jgi:tRNA threonylcarbamoyl adenosine modification protein YjeE
VTATADVLLDEAALARWGEALGRAALKDRVFVALEGPLGAGKTTLVRAAVRGAGGGEEATSPTFSLVHRHETPAGPVYHADLYRIESPAALRELGWEELVTADGPVFVEWADRAAGRLPRDRWAIVLALPPDGIGRRAAIRRVGDAPEPPLPAAC